MPKFTTLIEALKHFFGYDTFRIGQKQIIEEALQNRDLLVIMPTGGGKSLCFQLPALLKPGLTVVVSPLIALMQDQVDSLQDNGISATFLNSSLNWEETRSRSLDILSGKIKLLYVSPERLLTDKFGEFLDKLANEKRLAFFAIDEAHCVSEWGHDFRPEYRQLKQLKVRYPTTPILALTATATKRVQQDIVNQLNLRNPCIHINSFNRPNLYYQIITKEKRSYNQLLQHIRAQQGSGIVYCVSRKQVEDISFRLQNDGIKAVPYHAGMADTDRSNNQTRFLRDDVQVIVATIAFGMGINKPDVRFVFHYELPRSLEGYYQESGRAGRDGEPAKCVLFFSYGDVKKIEYLIDQKTEAKEQRISHQQLRQVIDYTEGNDCRRTIVLRYFGEKFTGNCGQCDNCANPKPIEDLTIEAQKFLSCVIRAQEKFGMNHIIDVLRGSKNKRVEQYGHHLLSTYNIGKEVSVDDWKVLVRSLLHQGLIDETNDGYRVLKLNKKSWEILRNQRQVLVPVNPKNAVEFMGDYNPKASEIELLLERLKRLRKHIADTNSVPPYVIFSDSSLRLMAQIQPQSLADFAKISGVGSYKLEHYGESFVSEIRTFCQEQSLPSALPASTHMKTLQFYQQGLSLTEIAEARNYAVTTIAEHIAELIELKQPIDLNDFVTPERQKTILETIVQHGDNSLKILKEALGSDYSYDEIKFVRAWWRRENTNV
jgi:ATP-dependent DNA helicase RecQ